MAKNNKVDTLDVFPKNYRVCLYGAGELGRVILQRLKVFRPDISVPFFIDTFQTGIKYGVDVLPPDVLVQERKHDYDFVLITSGYGYEISETLTSIGVTEFGAVCMDLYARIQVENILVADEIGYSFKSFVIGITNQCNMACRFCESTINPKIGDKRVFQSMDYELFKSLINHISEYSLTNSVDIVGSGEPLLYPKLQDAIQYCKSKQLTVSTFTNGLLLTTDKYSQLVQSGLDRLYISLHSLSQDSFQYRHKKMQFQTYFANILSVIEYHAARRISSEMIIRLMYAPDDGIAVGLWDVPNIEKDTQHVFHFFSIFLNSMEKIATKHGIKCHLSEKAFERAFSKMMKGKEGQVLDIIGSVKLNIMCLVPPSFTNYQNLPNHSLWGKICFEEHSENGLCNILDRPVIKYDGSVFPCCGKEDILIGKIDKKTTLIDVFKSNKYKELLQGFRAGKLVFSACRKCQGKYAYV